MLQKNKSSKVLAVALLAMAAAPAVQARDVIQIAGSSTVLPFASIVAEEFGQAFVQFRPPVVASGGSSGGLRQFCQGVGDNTIDIANSSRPIKPAEVDDCAKAGVKQILQVKVGYDGIVFASRADRARFALTPQQVFAAAAEQIPQDGKLVKNPYTRWSQIDKSLPDQEIVLVIPAANHGTREVFEEKVIFPGCNTYPVFKALEGDANKAACAKLRQDGRIIEIAGDYTETLARLQAQPEAVGVFGLSFYEQNRDRLVVATVNGVTPSLDTVLDGRYPVSRPLYFYVKGEHIGLVPGLAQYAEYFISDAVSGGGSPLESAGLIPLGDDERAQVLADFKARKIVK
ncbi:substrate-binding domain-containing protein [Sinimarinibacterium sp. NLF-5-8]|uniref:substrate-binding domain-containing protein n=1 Tax=Sinimarinibacterium sp. NLF-5-8 TaxID=2698684 RepID=UPI00137BC8E4|nr:substrate-binding domain-containing protein [Sinimarinibacterium sp. NLF-5-8]QHS11236.1 phosphonate ABC transporter substrate-binding protein [Sinimarinibacterium sp. NLF-5-8]